MKLPVDSPRGQLLTGTAAAQRLGIGYDALLRLVRSKRLAAMRFDNGRLHGIYEADCDAYVEEHRVRAERTPERPRPSLTTTSADIDRLLEGEDERQWLDA